MPDFSTISQAPEIRSLVQEGLLERAFHDALFPRLLFRGEALPQLWPNNAGDVQIFTGSGLIAPKLKPLTPGTDPQPESYASEQWEAQLQQYASSIDTHMPTAITAIANLFLRNAHQLGMQAGQSLNRAVRNRLYNAAMSGHTVVDGTQADSTSVRVARLNGFTRARNPDTAGASRVRFSPVSASNPLAITIAGVANTVVGYTPDNAGDEFGPGVLTLGTTSGGVTDRDAVVASDATGIVRVGGGTDVDDLAAGDILDLDSIRTAVSRFWQQNVPEMADGRYHCHIDPTSQAQVFSDAEFQRLLTSLPDYYMYKRFAIGELLNTVFLRNSECPLVQTVEGGATYTTDDPFGGELLNATSVAIHRPLFVAQGAIYEYYQDLNSLITEAGVTGKVASANINNNGIEINTDRIQMIIRAPLNRLQDLVSTSWKFIGDWPVRTDAASGDAARYKRVQVIEHGA